MSTKDLKQPLLTRSTAGSSFSSLGGSQTAGPPNPALLKPAKWSWWRCQSYWLGWLDYGFLLVQWCATLANLKVKFFSHGYGNVQLYTETVQGLQGWMRQQQQKEEAAAAAAAAATPIKTKDHTKPTTTNDTNDIERFVGQPLESTDIEWEPAKPVRSNNKSSSSSLVVTMQAGKFKSPMASVLPPESEYCHFYRVEPAAAVAEDSSSSNDKDDGTTKPSQKVYVILLPAMGEEGSSLRLSLAQDLAHNFGWSSLLVTAPYYKNRRPANQTKFFLNAVEHVFWQGFSVIQEAAQLAEYVLHQDDSAVVCWTGFSFGAAMAACSANWALHCLPLRRSSLANKSKNPSPTALERRAALGQRMGVCAYVGSASPNVFCDGILQQGIDWSAISSSNHKSQEAKRQHLFQELSMVQLNMFFHATTSSKKRPQLKVAKAVSMAHDAFLKPHHSHEFACQMHQCLDSALNTIWMPGGHVWAAIQRPTWHKQFVSETVQELLHDDDKDE